jgi:predicted AlkP superfamily pyrophosphatase or phosphodiesterase
VKPLLVLDVVGLTPALMAHAPRIAAIAREGFAAPMTPVVPAVTCPAQSTMLTGRRPSVHGVVGNGWYDRERAEVAFWKQSNRLVAGEMVWDAAKARDASFTCANVCWWFAMYGTHDVSVTPRPAYPADGRKVPDCWTKPADLRDRLQAELGTFPLFTFWGPKADITSTRWIAEAAKRVLAWHAPTLALVYLPHLDYPLQKLGPANPAIPRDVAAVDEIAGDLADAYRARGYGVVVLSEYGIVDVRCAVTRPARRSTTARRARSRSPTTRSRTSTARRRRTPRRRARRSRRPRASRRCSRAPRARGWDSTTRVRATS